MYRKGTRTGRGSGMRLMYIGNAGYYRYMQFKQYLKLISGNQIISEKLSIINFCDKYGFRATKDAFNISRSTIYNWKKLYRDSKYNPKSLIPKSKRPKNTRKMVVDEKILYFIQSLRNNNYRLGKSKIKVLLDPYCDELKVNKLSEPLIGKIIKRKKLFFPKVNGHKRKIIKRNKSRLPGGFKPLKAGECVQIDTIVRFNQSIKTYILTAVDVYSRFSFSYAYRSLSSRTSLDFMQKLENISPFPIVNIKTDNGYEFLGEFDRYLVSKGITHFFSYPRTPKSNSYVERFNRSIQEEFLDYHIYLVDNLKEINTKLIDYLIFFNTVRPHYGLDNLTPMGYLVFKGILSNMSVTHTPTLF